MYLFLVELVNGCWLNKNIKYCWLVKMGGCCISRASGSFRNHNRGYALINRTGNRVFTLLKPGDRTSRRGTYNLGAGYLRVDNRPDPAKYILVNNINGGIIELDVNREFSTVKSQLLVHPEGVRLMDFRSSIGVYDKSTPHGTVVALGCLVGTLTVNY